MITKQQAQEYLIDLILNYIITYATSKNQYGDDVGINLNDYRRYINPSTGQITIGNTSNDSSVVLYEKDFRESFSSDLLNVIDTIINNCINLDNELEDEIVSAGWSYIPGGNSCVNFQDSNFGAISFTGPLDGDVDSGTNTYDGCEESYGNMSCSENSVIDLVLTDDVLASLSQFIPITQQQTDIDGGLAGEVLDTNIYELSPGGLSRQEQINKFFADYNNLKAAANKPPIFIDSNNDNIPDMFDNSSFWTENHDISAEGDYITRLNADANNENVGKTLQSLRDDLNTFLYDVDNAAGATEEDNRTEYQPQSGGYLKFRGLNQAIIIRNTEGTDVGLENYKSDGFTITMWVRFLDKVSNGTLFNYGNPLRAVNPNGFMLETHTVTDTDRYLRLVLRDGDDLLRDSHVGTPGINRESTIGGDLPTDNSVYTSIPIDFSEWYFIVATFDPNITEDTSFTADHGSCNGGDTDCLKDGDFWRNNIDSNGYIAKSTEGAMCKVEVISKSDLLRARGFQG